MFQIRTFLLTCAFAVFEFYVLSQINPTSANGTLITSNIMIGAGLSIITLSLLCIFLLSFFLRTRYSIVIGISLSFYAIVFGLLRIYGYFNFITLGLLFIVLFCTDLVLL